MPAYYNEHDPKAAAWLRELIRAGLITQGDVDERSIADVRSDDLRGYVQCHFFAGIGVWSYALRLAGWDDARPVWSGSCPCQPFSAAGKGDGYADKRHLWPHWYRLIGECRPDVIFGEQVDAAIRSGWLDDVCLSLESLAYAVGPVDFPACSVGTPNIRQRLYFVADLHGWRSQVEPKARRLHGDGPRRDDANGCGTLNMLADPEDLRRPRTGGTTGDEDSRGTAERGATNGFWRDAEWIACRDGKARPVEPGVAPLVTRTAARVVKLRGYGNAINAEAARTFIEAYLGITP